MMDDIDPAAPHSEMQDLDCILEQDFGIEDILDQQVLAQAWAWIVPSLV